MKEDAVALRDEIQPANVIQGVMQIATNPDVRIDVIERMLALHERLEARQAQVAFMGAMAKVAVKVPAIVKTGQSHHGMYAKLEDIDRILRPILSEEGLSLSFDSQPSEGKVRVFCKLSHSGGHSETKQIDLPLDNSGSKNGAQSVISTVSYGRRALTKMFFNLIEAGEDTDGNNPKTIDDGQIKDLEILIADSKSNKAVFLEMIAGVERIEDLPARDFKRCVTSLEAKIRINQEKKK